MNSNLIRQTLSAILASMMLVASARAHEFYYDVVFSGPGSPGTGTASVLLDLDLVTMAIDGSFSGLLGSTTGIVLHCCTVVAGTGSALAATAELTPSGFPLGVSSGNISLNYDLTQDSTYDPAFVVAQGGQTYQALNGVIFGAAAGTAYLSILTSAVPGGEITGFLVAAAVPEPASQTLMLMGLGALIGLARWRKLDRLAQR